MKDNSLLDSIDLKPLQEVGLSKEESANLLASLAPLVDLELQEKIKATFNDEEMESIADEAETKGIKPEDGSQLLEEKYFAKTGKYFMEEALQLFNVYAARIAEVLVEAKKDTKTFTESGDDNIKKFNELVTNNNWEEAAKLFEQTLKK